MQPTGVWVVYRVFCGYLFFLQMQRYKVALVCLFLVFFCQETQAQTDSLVRSLAPLVVTQSYYKQAYGIRVVYLDSLNTQNGSLDAALNAQTNSFVRNYGSGTLALPALRGTGSSHTAVVWNGINLQSAMNGAADLALLPNYFFENASLILGSTSSLYGSGAVGGTIVLNDKQRFESQPSSLEIKPVLGSFGYRFLGTKYQLGTKKLYIKAKALTQKTQNNYSYQSLDFGLPQKTLQNAQSHQLGYMVEMGYKPNENNVLNLKIWQQLAQRHIPPTLTSAPTKAYQTDSTTRAALSWQYQNRNFLVKLQTAYTSEKIFYTDSLISLFARNRAIATINELEIKQVLGKITLMAGTQYSLVKANSTSYQAAHTLNQMAVFGQINAKINAKINASLVVRRQFVDFKPQATTPSFGLHWQATNELELDVNAAKSYRLPTLNDLFWQDSGAKGNPELLPESGNNFGFGAVFSRKNVQFYGNFFYYRIKNNIIWLPNPQNIWQPENIQITQSKGVELGAKYEKSFFENSLCRLSVKYTHTQATDLLTQKQLIYTPKNQASAEFDFIYKNLKMTYQHQYTGLRYATADNLNGVKPYQIASLGVHYRLKIKGNHVDIQLQTNNLYNTKYQVLAYRIMPPRNFLLGVGFNFKTKQTTIQ